MFALTERNDVRLGFFMNWYFVVFCLAMLAVVGFSTLEFESESVASFDKQSLKWFEVRGNPATETITSIISSNGNT